MGVKTKREKKIDKVKVGYNNLTLSRRDFNGIPQENRAIYLSKIICKKYNIEDISFKCEICATAVAFDDSGYITDDDLLDNKCVRLKFKHK